MITIIRNLRKKEKKKKDGTQGIKMIAKDWSVGQIGREF